MSTIIGWNKRIWSKRDDKGVVTNLVTEEAPGKFDLDWHNKTESELKELHMAIGQCLTDLAGDRLREAVSIERAMAKAGAQPMIPANNEF